MAKLDHNCCCSCPEEIQLEVDPDELKPLRVFSDEEISRALDVFERSGVLQAFRERAERRKEG